MNKILTLYNIEFKRIYKFYFALLAGLVGLNIAIFGTRLYATMYSVSEQLGVNMNIGLLNTIEARQDILQVAIYNMYSLSNLVLGAVVLLCLVYAIAIWYRDFVGKSKTAYTLFMLPNNKFAIYIAKAITMVVMIYGVMVTQIITWGIGISILTNLSGVTVNEIKELLVYSPRVLIGVHLIQPYYVDFIMINIIGVILAVVTIFTGVMIQMVHKKKGVALGILYVLGIFMMFIGTIGYSVYSDVFLMHTIIFYVVAFVLSIWISYDAINKKIYM